jgi:hypothetical protein
MKHGPCQPFDQCDCFEVIEQPEGYGLIATSNQTKIVSASPVCRCRINSNNFGIPALLLIDLEPICQGKWSDPALQFHFTNRGRTSKTNLYWPFGGKHLSNNVDSTEKPFAYAVTFNAI